MLQWVAWERGHSINYGVRFHCECAPVEALWAFIVHLLRNRLDGTPKMLLALLIEFLAFTVKPDVCPRLFNRPTECWQLYTLAVVSNDSLEVGLSAPDVIALQSAFSGYSNRAADGAAHARASAAGADADASFVADPFDGRTLEEENEGGELAEDIGLAPPLATGGAPAAKVVAAAAAAGVGSAGVAAPVPDLPDEVPSNLWELLSCVKEAARRAITDRRRKVPRIYEGFVAAVQRTWNSDTGRAVLRVLESKTLLAMTVEFAMKHSIVLYLGVRSALPFDERPAAVPQLA